MNNGSGQKEGRTDRWNGRNDNNHGDLRNTVNVKQRPDNQRENKVYQGRGKTLYNSN